MYNNANALPTGDLFSGFVSNQTIDKVRAGQSSQSYPEKFILHSSSLYVNLLAHLKHPKAVECLTNPHNFLVVGISLTQQVRAALTNTFPNG